MVLIAVYGADCHQLAACSQEKTASGELEGAAGLLPLEAAAKASGLNWSELYAIVGSLFESNMSVPQHLAMLDHLPREQRCAVASACRGVARWALPAWDPS